MVVRLQKKSDPLISVKKKFEERSRANKDLDAELFLIIEQMKKFFLLSILSVLSRSVYLPDGSESNKRNKTNAFLMK